MNKNIIKNILIENGYEVVLDKPYKNIGYRLKTKQGSAVFCINSGSVYAKGKLKEPLEILLNNKKEEWEFNDNVFVVYGHDVSAKAELIEMLRQWELNPLYLDSLPTEGRTIIEQLEQYIPQANYGIVLATPDDTVCYDGEQMKLRARQNVVLELGMLYSRLGRKKVAIVIKEDERFERPSDIDGVLYFQYKNSVNEVAEKIRKELKKCGYNI